VLHLVQLLGELRVLAAVALECLHPLVPGAVAEPGGEVA